MLIFEGKIEGKKNREFFQLVLSIVVFILHNLEMHLSLKSKSLLVHFVSRINYQFFFCFFFSKLTLLIRKFATNASAAAAASNVWKGKVSVLSRSQFIYFCKQLFLNKQIRTCKHTLKWLQVKNLIHSLCCGFLSFNLITPLNFYSIDKLILS